MTPREKAVHETEDTLGVFSALDGPVEHYRRIVTVTPGDKPGTHRVHQRVEVTSAIPFWGWLFGRGLAANLGRLGGDDKAPFWYPPDRLDARASTTLARIATLAFVLGYGATLLTQTITYAAGEFHADKGAQGLVLAAVRLDVLLSLPLTFLADRRGRRRLAVQGTIVACALTALGAFAPNLAALGVMQVLARGVGSAAIVTIGVMVAEEMPAGARAWATSIVTIAGVGGAGICLLVLPIADLSPGAWRAMFLFPLVLIPLARSAGKHLEETDRFKVSVDTRTEMPKVWHLLRTHRQRFVLLAGSAALLTVFATPAAQFQNEFLRTERGFSGAEITLFVVLTALPGGIGIVVGGRFAERGRRLVGALATFVGVGATALMFYSSGVGLYAWSALGSLIGAAAVPALGVYGAELFPTEARGAANGGIGFASRLGSVIGLVVVGQLADHIGLPSALAWMAIGPLILTVLILTAYPETAHRELEDLNPEDQPLPE